MDGQSQLPLAQISEHFNPVLFGAEIALDGKVFAHYWSDGNGAYRLRTDEDAETVAPATALVTVVPPSGWGFFKVYQCVALEPGYGLACRFFGRGGWHQVAEVVARNLDHAYQLTNHISRPWWENAQVLTFTPESRSTSIGDVIVSPDGVAHYVDTVGFRPLVPDPAPLLDSRRARISLRSLADLMLDFCRLWPEADDARLYAEIKTMCACAVSDQDTDALALATQTLKELAQPEYGWLEPGDPLIARLRRVLADHAASTSAAPTQAMTAVETQADASA